MARDHARSFVSPGEALFGAANLTATETGYLPIPRACYLRELESMVNADAGGTSPTMLITVDYTTDGATWTNVHTDAAAIAGTSHLQFEPYTHTISTASSPVRIPAGSCVRVVATIGGTSPTYNGFQVVLGLDPV